MMDRWERLESACRARWRDCVDWDSDWGSLEVRDARGSVVSRFRYAAVVGSLEDGGARGEGASKWGASSSYRGSAIMSVVQSKRRW